MAMVFYLSKFLILFLVISSLNTLAQRTANFRTFDDAVNARASQAEEHLWANISRSDTPQGFIVASPSRVDPDYYFHWVRDAALVMRSLDLISASNNMKYKNQVTSFVMLESQHQKVFKISDQGEPKFNADGTSFQGPWGRPQNDGPALRSAYLSQFALKKLSQGDFSYIRKFYAADLPARSILKIDFEYISHQWHKPDFDLWEEIQGQHFYTRMVQAHALKLASKVAEIANDKAAKQWYEEQAILLEKSLFEHVNNEKIILSTVKRVGGLGGKKSLLDSSVILAVLHTDNESGVLGMQSEEILKTFIVLDDTFKKLYAVNQQRFTNGFQPALGTAIGRYPEDTFFGGNPWFLLTSTFAEFSYRQALLWKKGKCDSKKINPKIAVMINRFLGLSAGATPLSFAKAWQLKGDQYLARVLYHTNEQGHQSEQIDRVSGFMKGANDLTWSYAAYLTAVSYRKKLLSALTK